MSDLQSLIKDFEKFTFLLVDDKSNFRRTLRNMLRSLKFRKFRDAGNGKEALDRLKNEKFDFIICDWKMPIMNGVEFLQVIREDEGFQDIPFLMITAEVEEATVAQALEAGVDGYILKPFLLETLETKISEIMTNKLVPSTIEVQVQLARVFMKSGDYTRAHEELDKASALNQKSPRVLYARGLIFDQEKNEQKAEECFILASQLGPMFIKAHEKLAEMYEEQGRTAEMLTALEEIIKISPNNPDRQTRLGKALLGSDRIAEAKRAFNKAMTLDVQAAAARTAEIGEAYLSHGLITEAENAFKASLDANPGNIFVYNRLAIALRRQQKFDEAISYYQKALTFDPDEEYLYYNLARAYLSAQNIELAKTALQKALSIQPGFQEAVELLDSISD
ncbi:MAG: tetratricopeptide repeat protein [Deltaproteobacteria bacterium]|nr:tetratricopeptide repeat protein [Deltaproteobacteria bacterium]